MEELSRKMLLAQHVSKTKISVIRDAIAKHLGDKEFADQIINQVAEMNFKFNGEVLSLWADCCQMTVADLVKLDEEREMMVDDKPEIVDVNMNLSVNIPGIPKEAANEMKEMVSNVFEMANSAISENSEKIGKKHGLTKVDLPKGIEDIVKKLANGIPEHLQPAFFGAATEAVKKMAGGRRGCNCADCAGERKQA
ncbi:hypothetical protein VCHA31O73_360018 [Vibrio chagasii]|nr:hypothetical protein VCHA31O73_360018 [Vibrio chagasii]